MARPGLPVSPWNCSRSKSSTVSSLAVSTAFVALGLTLIYGTMHVPNFAHGHLYMLGAYLTYPGHGCGLHYWAATGVSMIVLAGVGLCSNASCSGRSAMPRR